MTQKTSKEEWELRLKRIYETEIEKKKKWPPYFAAFLSRVENGKYLYP